jgi:hypothetical protein
VVPELIEELGRGRGHDRFRMSLYEAAALGVNMSVPYGSWMGAVIEDSFYAPHELCVEIQSFLADHEQLYSRRTYAEVAVVYSIPSTSERIARRDAFADNRTNVSGDEAVPFLDACRELSDARQPYDVVFFGDGELRPDTLGLADIARYRTLVLPDCNRLTAAQAALLHEYVDAGGRLVVTGALGAELAHARLADGERLVDALPDGPQLAVEPGRSDFPQRAVDPGRADFAICVHRVERGAAVHLIRYDHDDAADAVPALAELELDLRLPEEFARATPYSPGGDLGAALSRDGTVHRLRLTDVPLYGVVLLEA